MLKKLLLGIATLLGLVGLIFFFQGIGVIPGSFMTGNSTWAVIGGAMIFLAVAINIGFRRR